MQIMYKNEELQETASSDHHSSYSIDKLFKNIGPEEGKQLLVEALPIIETRKNLILKALEQDEISVACGYAHKTSGSIRLYGSIRLEALLQEVVSIPANQAVRPALYSDLEAGFDEAISEIQKRLKVGLV